MACECVCLCVRPRLATIVRMGGGGGGGAGVYACTAGLREPGGPRAQCLPSARPVQAAQHLCCKGRSGMPTTRAASPHTKRALLPLDNPDK